MTVSVKDARADVTSRCRKSVSDVRQPPPVVDHDGGLSPKCAKQGAMIVIQNPFHAVLLVVLVGRSGLIVMHRFLLPLSC